MTDNPTTNVDVNGRTPGAHRWDVNTGAYWALPKDRRPYRPAKFAPTRPAVADSSATQEWPVNPPRPAVPPAEPSLTTATSGRYWSRLPWPARAAGIVVLVAICVVVAVIAGWLS